ncbi:MAG: 4Fe-4S dicluster domain-containing protein [Clostridiales bacterium]|nr:4Fe-4S dicluster domain-containing protein [Clostridiales bacterium]
MIYNSFKDKKLSALAFGAMRLPVDEGGKIDEKHTFDMVDLAMKSGVNYYDTAYPYHGGMSEVVMGKALARYPRESFYLATKFPGHQISSSYDPKGVFEEQLAKCGVEYFDFYLLHNVYENSIGVYMDEKLGILDYFVEQKRLGRIKHLGFSTHGGLDTIKKFLDYCGDEMEFCQIQLNYLDWTLQDAKAKYDLLCSRNIPVFVMEPVRGGRLAKLDEQTEAAMRKARPDDSIASWAMRWLMGKSGVTTVLSGMSNLEQTLDNIKTFSSRQPLTESEQAIIDSAVAKMHSAVPCTSCRYCVDGCESKINIPMMISIYNEIKFSPSVNASMRIEAMPEENRPAACISCGKCVKVCPQNIDIPAVLKDLVQATSKMPKWADISREREEAAKKLKASTRK